MKRILVITNNLTQASFRLRIQSLIEPLATHGLMLQAAVRPRDVLARRRLLRSAAGYDAVILQRKLLGWADARLLRRSARRIFLDVDDAVMFGNDEAGLVARWRAWHRFRATASCVDHAVAGNDYLAEFFRRRGTAVSVLPTVVETAHYLVKTHAPTSSPTLVWIGSHSTLPYLSQLAPALAEAARHVAGLKLLIVADQTLESGPLPIEHIPWSVQTEAAALCRGDIGIAPTPANPWTRGKCGFKIVQYMAAGLPVIASPIGANAELVVEGETGLLPAALEDWPGAIAALANDAQRRAAFGAAARLRAEREFSLQRAVDFWAKLLHEP